jgi:hypothetical protein
MNFQEGSVLFATSMTVIMNIYLDIGIVTHLNELQLLAKLVQSVVNSHGELFIFRIQGFLEVL